MWGWLFSSLHSSDPLGQNHDAERKMMPPERKQHIGNQKNYLIQINDRQWQRPKSKNWKRKEWFSNLTAPTERKSDVFILMWVCVEKCQSVQISKIGSRVYIFEGNIILCGCLMGLSSQLLLSNHISQSRTNAVIVGEGKKHDRTTARTEHWKKQSAHKDSKQQEVDQLTRQSGQRAYKNILTCFKLVIRVLIELKV